MKKQHRGLIGAAALSLAVAGSLAGAVPTKADGECIGDCDTSPRAVALGHVLDKMGLLLDKATPLDKSSPLISVMDKIQVVLKW